MPVEQGLPWHPVATGLAGQAIPFIVAASHVHALPSAPFWFPVPAILVASPALLCPSSLFAVLALVPPGVAPAFGVSVLLLPLSVGAPGCPCRASPTVPPACPPVPGFHISVRHGLSRARLAGHGPVATPVAGTSRRAGRSPRPCGVCGHLVEAMSVLAEKERARNWEERKQQSNWAQGRPTHGSETSSNRTHNNTQGNHEVRALQQPPNAAHAKRAISKPPPLPLLVCGAGGGGGQHVAPCIPLWLSGCPTWVGWYQGHRALLHMSPNLQTDLSLVFVGVVLG